MSRSPNDDPATSFRDVVIIGGGCYGSFYAAQLDAARAKGKATFRKIINVDHDPGCALARAAVDRPGFEIVVAEWGDFLDQFLDRPAPERGEPDDAIVPSPLMPHLMAHWLARVARARWPGRSVSLESLERPVGTPYDKLAPDGTRYVSFADWLCPTHCVEPLLCPVIRAPRTWEMRETLEALTLELGRERTVRGLAAFVTRHRAFGVGMFDVGEAREARRLLDGDPRHGFDVVVATISSCHGAISVLRMGDDSSVRST